MHMIPYQVIYTSFVYHNEGVNSQGRGQIVFRTSTAREAGKDEDDDDDDGCDNDCDNDTDCGNDNDCDNDNVLYDHGFP